MSDENDTRYRVSITRTTGHGRDRQVSNLLSIEIPAQVVPGLRSSVLGTLASYAFPADKPEGAHDQ